MAKIQVDMFEVQLGSAVLLQFGTPDGIVRVLADAGVSSRSGYPQEHVHGKLRTLLNGESRIDLIVGTHYDEDHLRGLVPILKDNSLDIGEIWLPPVANDTEDYAVDLSIDSKSLLPHQFYGELGEFVFDKYITAKSKDVRMLRDLERQLETIQGIEPTALDADDLVARDSRRELAERVEFFRQQLSGSGEEDESHEHAPDLTVEPDPRVEERLSDFVTGLWWPRPLESYVYWRSSSFSAGTVASLANLRRMSARDAINGASLFEVIKAIEERPKPPLLRTEIVEDGRPRHFRWDAGVRRFLVGPPGSDGLRFTLLGPSKSLVKRHRDRLPTVDLARVALSFVGEIRSITPSNQLSYIGRFEYAKQGILITGDAGCVDFKSSRSTYHQALLGAMVPLHVVQVAHHAGNNAHFYRVLAAAGYPEQIEPSFLLLSHAFHDKTRPSAIFNDFLLATVGLGDDVNLLFTSEPTRDKVRNYLKALYPLVGGGKSDVGDIRLEFDRGHWKVAQHLVQVT